MSCEPRLTIAAIAIAASAAACGPKAHPAPRTATMPVPTVRVGDCAAPEQDGVRGETPRFKRADRDLDGDGKPEAVVADESICTADGNCYWNVFIRSDGACERYAGALAGAVLEPQPAGSGWPPVRAYWNLGGGKRVLVQEYQFRRGGYILSETLICRRQDDDRLQCTEDTR